MKNRKKIWLHLIMIVLIQVAGYFQLTSYIQTIQQNSEKNYSKSQDVLLVHHEDIDHRYWVLSLGLIQAALLLGAVWLGRTHFSKFEYHAFHDFLTGLPNRWYVDLHLDWACSRAEAHGDLVILAFIDLNGFKPINDTFGHDKGDHVLKYIANNLRANCRSGDMAFRYGGDEFIVVFVTPANQSYQSLERIKNLIRTTFGELSQFSQEGGFGAAVGISVFPSCAKNSNMLVQTADQAMYRAKQQAKAENESLVIVEYRRDFARRDLQTGCQKSEVVKVQSRA
jgi:diguanylate cyclase (GGDEF)-like protein